MEKEITSIGAFIAGLLSFLSPCVLPLIPSYIAFISGVSLLDAQQEKINKLAVFIPALFFVFGFSTVFIVLGATASSLGSFISLRTDLFAKIGGGIVIFFGLITAGVINIPFLKYEKRFRLTKSPIGLFGAFIVGIIFAFGWSPCVGPILYSILTIAAQQGTIFEGVKLLVLYSAGFAIPFLIVPFGIGSFVKFITKMKKYTQAMELIAGKLLVTMGLLLAMGTFKHLGESLEIISLMSAGIFVTIVSIVGTQIGILLVFVNWLSKKGEYGIPWSARLMFFLDLMSISMLTVINALKEAMMLEEF
jgi:cytochrome c-type biogenesis protein